MLPVERIIDELARFEGAGGLVLSVYLRTDPSSADGRNLRAQLHTLLRPFAEQAPADVAAVRAHVAELATPPRSLAVFSCAARGLFHAVPLAVRLEPAALRAARPHLRPLLAALDEHEPVLLLLIDKEVARIFRVRLGDIEELDRTRDWIPPHHAQGGESQRGHQGYHDTHVHWHVRDAVDRIARMGDGAERVLIGGPPEALARVDALLPAALRARVAGALALPLYASAPEVRAAVQERMRGIERAGEERLLDRLQEADPARVAWGADAVIEAIVQQRADLLLMAADASIDGGVCTDCAVLVRAPLPAACPGCGGSLDAADLADRLALRVVKQGGRFEELHGAAARRLAPHDGVAARLRYAVPAEPVDARA